MGGSLGFLVAIHAAVTAGVLLACAWRLRRDRRRLPEAPRERADRVTGFQRWCGTALGIGLGVLFVSSPWLELDLPPAGRAGLWLLDVALVAALLGVVRRAGHGLLAAMRGPGWNRARYAALERAVMPPVLLPILIAAAFSVAGHGLAFGVGAAVPPGLDAAWLALALPLAGLVQGRRLRRAFGRPGELPDPLHAELRQRAGADAESLPPVHVIDTAGAQFHNAVAVMRGRSRSIWISDCALAGLKRDEAVAILLHELGHLHHRHPRQMALWIFAGVGAALLLLALTGHAGLRAMSFAYLASALAGAALVLQRNELAADRFAAERCDAPETLARALRKLHALALAPEQPPDARFQTHPALAARIRALGIEPPAPEPAPPAAEPAGRVLRLAGRVVLWLGLATVAAWALLLVAGWAFVLGCG